MNIKNTPLPIQTTLTSKGRILKLDKPVVMGILNATPDSFFNKGKECSQDELLQHAAQMIEEGAAILDIGGVSTRPGAEAIETSEELDRIIPAIEKIRHAFPNIWISADTTNSAVARHAVAAGADIINDISSSSFDNAMLSTVAELGVPYVAMHMQGTPATMQQNPQYEDVVHDVLHYLRSVCDRCTAAGIKDVILDPGFGFGKTVGHNYALLKNMSLFRMIGKPVLAGISRKSMVCKPLGVSPANALNGTTALHMIALQQGASILRVHDVKEAVQVIKLWQELQAD